MAAKRASLATLRHVAVNKQLILRGNLHADLDAELCQAFRAPSLDFSRKMEASPFTRGLQLLRLFHSRTGLIPPSYDQFGITYRHPTNEMMLLPPVANGRGLATVSRPVVMKIRLSSPGVVAEPYKPPAPPLSFNERWFSRKGWRVMKENALQMFKTAYTLAKMRQKNKGHTQAKFYREATDLYREINKAFAKGDRTMLRKLVTENVFTIMKNQLKHREGTWDRVHWEMVGPIKQMRTLQARLIGIERENHDNAFVQITLKIQCQQIFVAYDKQGKQVAGSMDKQLLVEDIWVFEKHLTNRDSTWRLCGQL